jgi:GNAT superfamily N-acetyltransferase
MIICIDRVEDIADRLDDTLNHYGARKRVEDIVGRQKVDWEFYKSLEAKGMTLLLTANDASKLAGFALYVTSVHHHHPDALIGFCQFLIVTPTYRSQGLGKRLVSFAEIELKRRDCTHIIHGRRMVYDVEPLFPKLGFVKFEETFVKELK